MRQFGCQLICNIKFLTVFKQVLVVKQDFYVNVFVVMFAYIVTNHSKTIFRGHLIFLQIREHKGTGGKFN